MESDGFFHYREKMSLLQFAVSDGLYIVDPLAIRDLSRLGDILADGKIRKILHGADYDIRSFDREYGFNFSGLYDTALAIQLTNPEPLGLGRALERYLGVQLRKLARLQRSDWSRRPVPMEALEYAVGDVEFLFRLHDKLENQLASLGRGEWMDEECRLMEQIRYEAPDPPEQQAFYVKGAFDLPPRNLSIFRELYLLRDKMAQRMDRPPFKVVSNEALMAIAQDPELPLERVPNANLRRLKEMEPELKRAVERGRQTKPLVHPSRLKRTRNPWNEEGRLRWRKLHEARAAHAHKLNIAPSVLWPAKSLEQVALDPGIEEREFRGNSEFGVRKWQQRELGAVLARLCEQGV